MLLIRDGVKIGNLCRRDDFVKGVPGSIALVADLADLLTVESPMLSGPASER
jgi:hypothetical protein